MNNDNTNTNNNSNEEFVLDFDDDVVDLTDSNRKNTNSYNSNISNSYNSNSYNSGSYNSNNYSSDYNSNYNSNSYNNGNYNADYNSDYSSGYNNFSSNDDPYGAYNPNRDLSLSNNAEKTINNTYKNDLNITFKLVIVAMIVMIAYMAYLAFSKNPFTNSLYYYYSWAVELIIEVAFISDAIVLKSKTGKTSPIIIAILISIFYPLISFSKRGLSKIIPLLWLILCISFTGKFVSHQYHILTTNPEYTKSSADHYDSKYDKPVKKLNAMKASSTSKKTVNDVIKDYFRNTSWDAKTNDDGSYSISVQGDAHDKVNGKEVLYKVKIGFTLSKSLDSYSVTSVSINSTQYNSQSQAQSFWNELVVGH